MTSNLNKATLVGLTLLAGTTLLDSQEFDTLSKTCYYVGLGTITLGAISGIIYSNLQSYSKKDSNSTN